MSELNPWLPLDVPAGGAPLPSMFCLPPSGAGASFYRTWLTRLQGVARVRPIQLPGRETRFAEPPPTDLIALAGRIVDGVAFGIDGGADYVLFGHSLGATLALEIARELRRRAMRGPALLVVSASRVPHREHTDDDAMAPPAADGDWPDFIRRLGGTPEEVLASEQLMELLIPTIRGDFTMLADYTYRAEEPLEVPMLIVGGREDGRVGVEELLEWGEHTTGPVRAEILPGGHFYFRDDPRFFDIVATEVERHAGAVRKLG